MFRFRCHNIACLLEFADRGWPGHCLFAGGCCYCCDGARWRSCSRREEERKWKRRQRGEERGNEGFAGEGNGVSMSRWSRWRREMEKAAAAAGEGERRSLI
ncbi:hypothetical protein KY290_021780 [Solanum tuberosum]|uniref:Uncharacterized protein n=1 Tax=Solanum tuberosum TaxID=4113 RepID=A0ABQ7V4M0_SOLTU|nr:hypothetical protein KY289_020944 [Solanum tuberosum]KAH0758287.1 hypothetical protein KY290_021780 [Solanum tuberosum]